MHFALNHMTVATATFADLVEIAVDTGCVGIELRNDLPGPLFDGHDPRDARDLLKNRGLRLLSLAELKRFNDWDKERSEQADALIALAKSAGSEAVSLIPRNDNTGMGNGERQARLRVALRELKPRLEEAGLIGLIEPLGFDTCALRRKTEATEAIASLDATSTFRLVHDTFHHHVAEETAFFPEFTGLVHISGVTDTNVSRSEMRDPHRGLVDDHDRLGTIDQIARLCTSGFRGPISFEAFSPDLHGNPEPRKILKQSMEFIRTRIASPVS